MGGFCSGARNLKNIKLYIPNRSFTDIIFNRSIWIGLICVLTTSNMEDIKIFIIAGDLLQDLPRTRGELSKFQEKDLLQLVETKFFSITGLHCDPRKFRNNVRKYVDKIKKNRRRPSSSRSERANPAGA